MNVAEPHIGRSWQLREIENILWMGNPECEMNAELLHHLETLGWKWHDIQYISS